MQNPKFLALAAAACLMSSLAQAGVVTYTAGHASRLSGSDFIDDSLNHRQWLGADVTRNLTYADALQAIAAGGRYQGYSLATTADALLLQQALAGAGAACRDDGSPGSVYVSCDATSQVGRVFGETYYDYAAIGWGDADYDYVGVVSDSQPGGADLIELYSDNDTGRVTVFNWARTSDVDYYARNGNASFGFLLFRDAAPAALPEPGTLALAGLAAFAVAMTRRRRAVVDGITR